MGGQNNHSGRARRQSPPAPGKDRTGRFSGPFRNERRDGPLLDVEPEGGQKAGDDRKFGEIIPGRDHHLIVLVPLIGDADFDGGTVDVSGQPDMAGNVLRRIARGILSRHGPAVRLNGFRTEIGESGQENRLERAGCHARPL